ncbi:unnamed protein product [Lota lota]
MVSSAPRRAVEVLLLTAAILNVSGIQILNLSLDMGTSYNFSNTNGRQSECPVCVGDGQLQTCKGSVLLRDPGSVPVKFNCPRPEDVIHVEIRRNIECTTQSCNGDIIMEEPNSLGGFNRTYVWTLKAVAPKAILIDFTRTGLRQINSSQACPDKQTYTLQAVGKVDIGRYCRTGPIGEAQLLKQGTFSLHVPAKEQLQAGRFNVSVGEEIKLVCPVDLSQRQGLSLNLEKIRPDSECRMTMNNTAKGTILVPPYGSAQLSFQDCSRVDVWITARRVIECRQLKDCSKTAFPLLVPSLPTCLPAPLRSVTWSLVAPAHSSTELLSPGDGLKLSLPGQLCNGSMVFTVSEDNGRTSLGQFCPRGPIQSIQFRTNVSVTASGDQGSPRGLRLSTPQSLSAHFKEDISERYIFTLTPEGSAPTLLASPGWPAGMKSYSTISWIVNVPAEQEAHLVFVNLSQPKCSSRHTNIRVHLLGSLEEMYSRREDEEAEGQIDVPGSFYLNMSNCLLEKGQFSMLTEMTLRKSRNSLLTIIASVVSALVVLFAVVLAVVCVVIRKKKKEMNRDQVSVYNPAGAIFRPGISNMPHSGEDEYHVYASIEDTLVYTHLLKKELKIEDYENVDTYRPFTGPTDPHRPPSSINPEMGTYRPFLGTPHVGPPVPQANRIPSRDQSMVHNDLHHPDGQSDLGTTEEPTCERPALGARMDPEGSD